MKRRQILAGIVSAGLTPTALSELADTRDSVERALAGEHAKTLDVDYWEETAERYGYGYQGQAPLAVLADLVSEFSDVRSAFRYSLPVSMRSRLCHVTARLAGMTGIVLHDLGQRREAYGWFHTAQHAAQEAGDRPLQGWLLAREAMIPLNYGAPQAAASLAQRAKGVMGDSRSAPAALACAVEARALAILGDRESATGSLIKAEAIMERLPDTGLSDTWFGYPEQKHHVHASQVLTRLHETNQARDSQARASDLAHSTSRISTALIQLDHAMCLSWEGETTEACVSASTTLNELPADFRTDLVLGRTRDVLRSVPVGERRNPSVIALDEVCRDAAKAGRGGA